MRRRSLRRAVGATATALTLALAAPHALAWWSDPGTATLPPVNAHKVRPQAEPECTNVGGVVGLLGSVDIEWAHVDDRYEYAWRVVRLNGQETASGVVTPTVAAGSPVVISVVTSLLNLGLGPTNASFIVTSRLKEAPDWTAATSTSTPIRTASLVVGLSVRCGHV